MHPSHADSACSQVETLCQFSLCACFRVGGREGRDWVRDWASASTVMGKCLVREVVPRRELKRAIRAARPYQFFYDSCCGNPKYFKPQLLLEE
eukprot:6210100-Pleurochrysis_carterae.AAC.3